MGKLIQAALRDNLGERFQNFIHQFQKDNVKSARRDMAAAERFADLEADLGFLAMLNVALLRLLSDKGLLKDGELMSRLEMADRLDGVEDGSLSMTAFRELIGAPRARKSAELAVAASRPASRPAPAAAAAPTKKQNGAKKLKVKAKARGRK
jgi:hypothetical protein